MHSKALERALLNNIERGVLMAFANLQGYQPNVESSVLFEHRKLVAIHVYQELIRSTVCTQSREISAS